ncbi:hypothetical protein GCM10009602_34700 [Nocardiopsis tropica]
MGKVRGTHRGTDAPGACGRPTGGSRRLTLEAPSSAHVHVRTGGRSSGSWAAYAPSLPGAFGGPQCL